MNSRLSSFLLCMAVSLLCSCTNKTNPFIKKAPEDSLAGSESINTPGTSSDQASSQIPSEEEILEEMEASLVDRINYDPDCVLGESSVPTIRTLTRDEYLTSVSKLFNLDFSAVTIREDLPFDSIIKGFRNLSEVNQPSSNRIKQYFDVAQSVAALTMEQRPEMFNCGQNPIQCTRRFLDENLMKIWRKPVTEEEKLGLMTLFEERGSDENAFQIIVARTLLSPYFLTIQRIGQIGQLNDYEIASSLAFTLWGEAPDNNLLQAAANQQLADSTAIAAKTREMIADERFDRGLKNFLDSWLEIDRVHKTNNSEEEFPGFNQELKNDIENEVFLVFRYLIDQGQDDFDKIFNIDFTFASEDVAKLYGYEVHPSGVTYRDHKMYKLPEARKGIFSFPGLLASLSTNNNTIIPARGNFILSKVLCTELPEPNAAVLEMGEGILPDTNLSARDSLQKMTELSACIGCHVHINGIGFGMENLGPIGEARTLDDHQKPVVASSTFTSLQKDKFEFVGTSGLSGLLSKSERAQQCMGRQIFRYVYERFDQQADSCLISKTRINNYPTGHKFSDVLVSLLSQPLFINRKVEVQP